MGGYLGNQPDAIKPPTLIFSNTTDVGTDANETEKDLISYTMPANKLVGNGHKLKIIASGTTPATGNTKQIRLKFGSATILDTTAIVSNLKDWKIEGEVIRTGSATQDSTTSGIFNDALVVPDYQALTEDLTSTVVIKVTGQNGATGAANDIVCENLTVELIET